MSSKQARKATTASLAPAGSIRQEVEKLIQKDRLKDAVKAAKLCFKDESTPENHRLLERAYFLRARQLLQLGMADSAIEVAEHLLEFGLTSDEWTDDFVRLLMNLGLADEAFQIQAKSGRPELKDQLLGLAADQAVIHPGRIQDTSPEIAREASLIRESLEKIRAGDVRKRRSRRCATCREARCFRTGSSLLEAWPRTTGVKTKSAGRTGTGSTPIARPAGSQIGCVNWPRRMSRASAMRISQSSRKRPSASRCSRGLPRCKRSSRARNGRR